MGGSCNGGAHRRGRGVVGLREVERKMEAELGACKAVLAQGGGHQWGDEGGDLV